MPLPTFKSCLLVFAALLLGACTSSESAPPTGSAAESAEPTDTADGAWPAASSAPPVPKGMVWIPPGALVAGTAPEQLPRKADEEMPGEQVVMEGFLIDQFAFPNEQGGIPRTNMTWQEARVACEERGKRLCSELEWERACKGPSNTTYEYGNGYVQKLCNTGRASRPLPSGYQFGCRSAFGVHDMHGGIWEWTDSPWGRGRRDGSMTLRGGNGVQGEVLGRCANGSGQAPERTANDIGFRCCSGKRNRAEVELQIRTGQALSLVTSADRELKRALEARLPDPVKKQLTNYGTPRVFRLWEWRPLANEDLLGAGVCAGVAPRRECGILIVRRTLGKLDVLDWAPSGRYVPTVKIEHNPRLLWVYGGDKISHYRRAVSFEWGRVSIGSEHRNVKL